MKVVSTNIAQPRTVTWNGKQVSTGIYKVPDASGIFLEADHVQGDHIADRKHHGGSLKACYLFGAGEYSYWKSRYPDLPWDWGMFGENVSLDLLDEEHVCVGDQYQLGNALVAATLPREPCYKLGIRFGDQEILQEFVARERPGVYLKVVEPGRVLPGDRMVPFKKDDAQLSIASLFRLLFRKEKNEAMLRLALAHSVVPEAKKKILRRYK